MDVREVLSKHRAGVAIASIGWIMNIPYWMNEYRFHSSLGHSISVKRLNVSQRSMVSMALRHLLPWSSMTQTFFTPGLALAAAMASS